MIVLMFRPRWRELILQGRKVQTVRPVGKLVVKAGDELSLRVWTGLPSLSRQEQLLRVHCTAVALAEIHEGCLRVGGKVARPEAEERFAWRDGFGSFTEMQEFFRAMHGLPFSGLVISWD